MSVKDIQSCMPIIGKNLKRLRILNGFKTLHEFCDYANIPTGREGETTRILYNVYHFYERGEGNISANTLKMLADYYRVSVDDFFKEIDAGEKKE